MIQAVAGDQAFALRAAQGRYFRDDKGLDVALLQLADDSAPAHDYVLVSDEIAVGDQLWTFGFGDQLYRGGKPATFSFEGFSRRRHDSPLALGRVHGTPVTPGYSGSPVANRRTGAVWGMLCTADQAGSAHMLPIAQIRKLDEAVQIVHFGTEARQRQWLAALGDDQLLAGGWSFPPSAVRAYLSAARKTSDLHPYSTIVPGVDLRPLSDVYVQSFAWENAGSDAPAREDERRQSAEVFSASGNSVLIGGAGTGKSSLLRMAVSAMVWSWEGLEPTESGSVPIPVLTRAVDLVGDRPFPELVALSVSGDPVVGRMRSWPAEMFARAPFPGAHWLILVDGLDELMSGRRRRAVLAKLARVHDENPGLFRFVVATRPLPDDETAIPPAWRPRCFQLLSFDDRQFEELAERWFLQLGLPDLPAAVERFTAQVRGSELTGIGHNPLMATMLCRLFAANPDGSLPIGRSRIFDAYAELLYDRQYNDEPGGMRFEIDAALRRFGHDAQSIGDVLALLPEMIGRLAWRRMAGETRPTVELMGGWLADVRPRILPDSDWHNLLRELLRRSGVLQERADDFVFIHQTIAEHQAARYVLADDARSDAAFRELFRAASWRDTASSARWQQSYARFLVVGWTGRPDLPKALDRVLAGDGCGGAQFVASLRPDGIELPGDLHRKSLDRLAGFAVDRGQSEQDRRAAATTVLANSHPRGQAVLAQVIRGPAFSLEYRRWALEALADAREEIPGGTASRTAGRGVPLAMLSLARFDDAAGRTLIADIAADSSWPSDEREWATEALLDVGDPRGLPTPDAEPAAPASPASQRFSPGEGVRRRLARLGAQRGSAVNPILEPLVKTLRAHYPKADVRLVERAYEVAAFWHRGQTRRSGDPYISHPLAVAAILAELGMSTETICAALLHDTVEDTGYTLTEIRSDFGEDVAALVDGVTKLDKVKYGDSAEAERVRKMVVAMSRDIRVLVIKLADRLHNMRTVRYLPRDTQERAARETLEIYAPLARRLGMNTVTWELEDLAFATLYPKRYDEIARLVAQRSPRREVLLREMIEDLATDLRAERIKAAITGRPKHYYSIYQKMITENIGFDEVYDLVGIRVLVDSVRDCYAALGTIHARWSAVPGQFADYIAMPRDNGYQSLHTTVVGPGGKPVELQIRTEAMHTRAEHGISAGYRPEAKASRDPAEMAWLRQLVDWQRETEDPAQFPDSLRSDLAGAEVYVFTPRGEVIALPRGATPVDFAYAIHTDVGHRTIGARVNGRLVALESTLDNGDTAEIFTSKSPEAGPDRRWLEFVKSARARKKIRQWLANERRAGVEVEGLAEAQVRLSQCCNPAPGAEIRGFVTRGRGVSLHRADCPNVKHVSDTQPERMVPVHWTTSLPDPRHPE